MYLGSHITRKHWDKTTKGGFETQCSKTETRLKGSEIETRRDFRVTTLGRDETLPQRDRYETQDFT